MKSLYGGHVYCQELLRNDESDVTWDILGCIEDIPIWMITSYVEDWIRNIEWFVIIVVW